MNAAFAARFMTVGLVTVWAVTTASPMVRTSLQPVALHAQTSDGMERLTVPGDLLPDGCRLKPTSIIGPNPVITTDPKALGVISTFTLGAALLEERSGQSPGATGTSKEERQAAAERSMIEAAAAVDIGYAAFYREERGSPEIGVYAVRLKKPLTEPEAQRWSRAVQSGVLAPSRLAVVKGRIAVSAWSDGRPGAPDRGCWEVVRRYLEQVAIE